MGDSFGGQGQTLSNSFVVVGAAFFVSLIFSTSAWTKIYPLIAFLCGKLGVKAITRVESEFPGLVKAIKELVYLLFVFTLKGGLCFYLQLKCTHVISVRILILRFLLNI